MVSPVSCTRHARSDWDGLIRGTGGRVDGLELVIYIEFLDLGFGRRALASPWTVAESPHEKLDGGVAPLLKQITSDYSRPLRSS